MLFSFEEEVVLEDEDDVFQQFEHQTLAQETVGVLVVLQHEVDVREQVQGQVLGAVDFDVRGQFAFGKVVLLRLRRLKEHISEEDMSGNMVLLYRFAI